MSPQRIPRYVRRRIRDAVVSARNWIAAHGGLITVLVVTYLVLGVSVVLALTAADVANSSKDTTQRVCRGQNEVRVTIRQLIAQQDRLLGKKGSPGYAYYVRHPGELANGHRLNRAALARFAPLRC